MGKKKATSRLKGAINYQIWWLRFKTLAGARGFDRLLKYREGYIDVIRKEAATMKLAKMALVKSGEDVGRSASEEFDTPHESKVEHKSISEASSSDDMSGVDRSDVSSGVESIATLSRSIGSRGKTKKRRTIESKVKRKLKDLYSLIIDNVSDEIAMKLARKSQGDGIAALKVIEKKYASGEVDRASDLKSQMKDLEPKEFKSFGDYMDGVLDLQRQLEEIGWPAEESMVRVFIRDKAPSDFRSFIATISRDKDMNLEDWVEEIASFAKQVEKDPKKVSKEERRLLACQARNQVVLCQLCDLPGHTAKECKKHSGEKRRCYNCGEQGHIGKDCPKPDTRKGQEHMKAKRAFKAAKKKLKKIEQEPKSSSSEEDDEDSSSSSKSSSSSSSSSSSDDGRFGDHIAVACRQAKVIHGKKAIKKTYAEASGGSSPDSLLSWEEYNNKSEKNGKLTRSRSWDGPLVSPSRGKIHF
jgi:hypothetical protein